MIELILAGIAYFLIGYFIGRRELPEPEKIKEVAKKAKLKLLYPAPGVKEPPPPEEQHKSQDEKEYDKVVGDKIKKMLKL